MVAQETIETIQLVSDMNAKIFVLCVLAVYWYFAYKTYDTAQFETISQKIYKMSLFLYSRVTLFFFPLMSVTFLHINTTLEEMIIFIAGFYGIVMVGTFVLLIILGFEKMLDMLGIDKGGMYK